MKYSSTDNIAQFIEQYDGSQQNKINFLWNGKHASDLVDANLTFRRSVIDSVLLRLDATPLILIRDLYTAETQFAKEAWGVNLCVSKFAEILLMRGGIAELDYYANGWKCGWDAYGASRMINLSEEIRQLLATECERRILDEKHAKDVGFYQLLLDFLSNNL